MITYTETVKPAKQNFAVNCIKSILYSKYKLKCLLIKDPSETSWLEYKTKTN